MSTTIVVTDEQVDAAQTLVAIMGGLDKVDPLIRKIAEAQPLASGPAGTLNGHRPGKD